MAVEPLARKTEPDAFGVLGPLQVVRSGRAVPLGGPRQRAVLALLLVEANRVVSMDRLGEDVWGGDPPDGWVISVQTYVFRLRQALDPGRARGDAGGVLVTSGRGYVLRAGREQVDAAVFEDGFTAGRAALDAGRPGEAAGTLRTALGLWRGPVLADLADYAFTRPVAARLEELRLAAVEARIDADLALGRHDQLTGELEQLAAEHPLRERLHGQLMLALYRSGRQADALAAYRRARDLLAGELGIDPGEPLQRLHASVLAHDPSLDWNGSRPVLAEDDRAGVGAPAASPPPGPPRVRPAAGGGEPAWARRRARRLLVIGSAVAVAAAVSIVVAARPWAQQQARLPANSVGLITSSGGQAGTPVAVGTPDGLAYGYGSVWAVDSSDNTLFRIDPATHAVVQTIPVGSAPTAVTVTGGNVWVANSGDGTVSQVNAAADAVVQTIRVGNGPAAIASGPSGVWVANQGDGTVDRISPVTGAVTMPNIPVGAGPDGIAVGPHTVWVANGQDGTVTRIDPATGQPNGPIFVGAGPAGIAVTPSAVWVANSLDLSVMKIDPAGGRVTAIIGVGDGPHAIAAGPSGVWVSDEFDATLARIDPGTGRVRKVFLGSSPQGLALTSSGVWVAARPFEAASHLGGTLTEVANVLPVPDPALAYDAISIPALAPVYDGLVALRKADGALGFTLVPDLATTLPRPANGGTTYTFTLRHGIRYSNGAPVRASDFRRGIQRQLSFGAVPGYYAGILGGPTCHQDPRRCNLSAGIVTNDAAGTITFHLTQPDPDFLYKLTLLLATPAPPGGPGHPIDRAPFLPGTGPYMISAYRPNVSLTLVRNPYFHQWSYAAQPAGYPNVIRFEQIADPRKQQSAVESGRADLVDISWNGQPYHPLALRYPTRVHSGVKIFTRGLLLNTHLPPFNNLKARQAVDYAIDRSQVIQLLGGGSPGQATVTCQILPAGFPGHQPYCPYTAGPKDGFWHGPDLAKARQLAQQSRTTNVPVTVWDYGSSNIGSNQRLDAYLAQLFRQLRYRVTVRDVTSATPPRTVRKAQVSFQGFGADFPTASNFFLPFMSCRSLDPFKYCNPDAYNLARQAQAAQLTDPAAARQLWTQVDRIVTNQAPWVPILNETPTVFVSARAGNYQESPYYGPLLDQIWVR